MTPARLLLARHGETDWNRDGRYQGHADIPLNELGTRQARALAERLSGESIGAIHASDLSRAAESARIVGAHVGVEPVLSPLWREINIGDLTGIHTSEIAAEYREILTATVRNGGGLAAGAESIEDVERRLRVGYDSICAAHAGETVLVVGHGGTLKVLIAMLIGLPFEHIENLSLRGNTSLSEISFAHGRAQLTMVNDTRHDVARQNI